jgi:hypothetical protein
MMYDGIDDTVVRSPINLLRSRATRASVLVFFVYSQLALILPDGWVAEFMKCVQMTLAFIVVLGYWRPATVCFFVVGRWPEKHNVIALGIEISWFSLFVHSAWSLLYRLSGQQAWMVNNDIYTAWTVASSFAATLHIFAPNMMGQGLPTLDKRKFAAAGALGSLLAVLVGFWRPDLRFVADWMHEHLMSPEWAQRGLIWDTVKSPVLAIRDLFLR